MSFFSERINQNSLPNIEILMKTMAADVNKYRSPAFCDKSPEDYLLANKMLLAKNQTSCTENLITNGEYILMHKLDQHQQHRTQG